MSENKINPDEWGLEELVKHTYREIVSIKEDQVKIKATLSQMQLENQRRKGYLAGVAAAVGFIAGLLPKFWNWFTHININ